MIQSTERRRAGQLPTLLFAVGMPLFVTACMYPVPVGQTLVATSSAHAEADANGALSLGATCPLCHAPVDSAAFGIDQGLEGHRTRPLDAGRIVPTAPLVPCWGVAGLAFAVSLVVALFQSAVLGFGILLPVLGPRR